MAQWLRILTALLEDPSLDALTALPVHARWFTLPETSRYLICSSGLHGYPYPLTYTHTHAYINETLKVNVKTI